MSKKLNDIMVSVLLLAEDIGESHTSTAINNVMEQTHKNIEVFILCSTIYQKLQDKYANNWRVKFIQISSNNVNYLNEYMNLCNGEYIFYKTVTNILWYPRHIQSHLEKYISNKKLCWLLSNIEYRDVDNHDHPLNTIGYRIDSPPDPNSIIIDEISHHKSIPTDWNECVIQHQNNQMEFVVGNIFKQWNNSNFIGVSSDEITVVQWIKFGKSNNNVDYSDVAHNLGIPARTDIRDENKLIGDDIEIVRMFPTVMGNSFLDEKYNNNIRNIIKTTVGIKSIAIKRTVGMGDIILCEPIIKKLRQKYEDATISFYTAKDEIVKYFKNKPDNIIKINEQSITNDELNNVDAQLKFDLDLAYESRLRKSFIDSYADVCDIKFDNYKDKYPILESNDEIDYSHIQPYVVVVPDGSGWIGKSWDLEKYKNIIDNLQSRGFTVVEPGFSDQSGLTDTLYHKCDLNKLISLLKQCAFYIGGDNGPMHIARSFNIPCVIIAGAALPYYSNPNRENIFYVQDSSLECLGCKHDQFFVLNGNNLSFVPKCIQQDQGLCLKSIKSEHVIKAIDKFLDKPKSMLTDNKLDFYFNIPKYAYYVDKEIDLIQRENVDFHPDQVDNLHEQYSSRWEDVYKQYSVPFVEEVLKHVSQLSVLPENDNKYRFLDVGCNIGLVVKAAIERNFDAVGIDMNKSSIDKGCELFPNISTKLICNSMDEFADNNQFFDVIACNQTLEHISNPVSFLQQCLNFLRSDGLIFVGVPSFDEENAREKWHKFQTIGTGEHVWLPTNKSFDYLMNKVNLKYEHLQDTKKGIFVKCWK